MEGDQSVLRRKRKPLADCTNIVAGSSQSSSSSASVIQSAANPSLFSALKRVIDGTKLKETRSKGDNDYNIRSGVITRSAVTRNRSAAVTGETNPTSAAAPVYPESTPSRTRDRGSVRAATNHENTEPSTVYTRRKTAEKRRNTEKTISEPVDCVRTVKTSGVREKTSEGLINKSKSSKVPQKKKQRPIKSEQGSSVHMLPQDFINQQRAYFAEVDAFELPEEEVTSVDELE